MIKAKVKNSEVDENGNLKVTTEYTLTDGEKVDGFVIYPALDFSRERVLNDIKWQCENLVRKTHNLKLAQELAEEDLTDIGYECETVEYIKTPEEYDADGVKTKEAEVITISDR